MNMDIAVFLIEGREERYLRHFFRDFAYNPSAIPEEDVQQYVMQMRQPGNLRAASTITATSRRSRRNCGVREEEADDADHGLGRRAFLRIALHRQRKIDLGSRRRWRDRGMRTLGV